MEIITLGKALETAKEKVVTLMVGDIRFKIVCTSDNLRGHAIGFAVSEGLAAPGGICVRVKSDVITVESANLQIGPSPAVVNIRPSGLPGLY